MSRPLALPQETAENPALGRPSLPTATWAWVWSCFASLLLVGCQATTPSAASNPVDPFFGRTRIEPPATGTVAKPGTIDPYYAASQAPATPATPVAAPAAVTAPAVAPAPAQQAPATQAPATQAPVVPRSGGVPRQPLSQSGPTPSTSATASMATPARGDLVAIPASARQATELLASRTTSVGTAAAATLSPATVAPPTGQAVGAPAAAPRTVIQTLQPQPKSAAPSASSPAATLPSTWPAPQAVSPPQKTASAAETASVPLAATSGRRVDLAVVPASATEPVAPPDNRYGYEPSYQWLRGKLEYSQIDKAWGLRYIPSDGATDAYGGSVVLAMAPQLSGFERGQFVEVHGRLVPPTAGRKTYAAGYEISQIQRVGP